MNISPRSLSQRNNPVFFTKSFLLRAQNFANHSKTKSKHVHTVSRNRHLSPDLLFKRFLDAEQIERLLVVCRADKRNSVNRKQEHKRVRLGPYSLHLLVNQEMWWWSVNILDGLNLTRKKKLHRFEHFLKNLLASPNLFHLSVAKCTAMITWRLWFP